MQQFSVIKNRNRNVLTEAVHYGCGGKIGKGTLKS